MTNIHQFFGISAGVISAISFVPYVRSILKGQTKPSGPSWWTWLILGGVVVTSSYSAHAAWSVLVLPAWLFVNQLTVAMLSIKYGTNNWDRLNLFCMIAAISSIVLWVITGQPLIALAISVLADLFASIPNFRHLWAHPELENRLGWMLGWGSSVLEVLAVGAWTAAESGWAIYFFLNMTANLILLLRLRNK